MELQTKQNDRLPLAAQGFLAWNAFNSLCGTVDLNSDTLQMIASSKNFLPVTLPLKADVQVQNKLREVTSYNVVAKIEGSDKDLRNEYVIYTAHWDHLGKDTTLKGDQIFNGAGDNASGSASLLEIAAGFAKLKVKPKRSILLLPLPQRKRGRLGRSIMPLIPYIH
jgi:hypothetical protein